MDNKEDIYSYLRNSFPQLGDALNKHLASIASLQEIPEGTVLMRAGQYMKYTILVAKGMLKLYREDDSGSEILMYHLEQGNACALSMVCAASGKTSEVMARAAEDALVIMIPVQHMEELMKNHKTWYQFVIESYRSRFEELLNVLDNIAFKNMDSRLFDYIRNQSVLLQTKELKLTHQEIASDLNSSREVISRLLKKMEQKKYVVLHRNFIEVLI